MEVPKVENCAVKLFDDDELAAANPASPNLGFVVEVKKLASVLRSCEVGYRLRWMVFGESTYDLDPQGAVFFVDSKDTYYIGDCIADAIYQESLYISHKICFENKVLVFFNPYPKTGNLYLDSDESHLSASWQEDSSEADCSADDSSEEEPPRQLPEQIRRLNAEMLNCLKP